MKLGKPAHDQVDTTSADNLLPDHFLLIAHPVISAFYFDADVPAIDTGMNVGRPTFGARPAPVTFFRVEETRHIDTHRIAAVCLNVLDDLCGKFRNSSTRRRYRK